MGIARDSRHKRSATGAKRAQYRKKRKFELGRQPAMTKLGAKRIHDVRTRGGNLKRRALRLESGNYAWASEHCTKKTRIIGVVYNASNNELVRTNTLVKGSIVQIDATPFRQWYESHYGQPATKKGKAAKEDKTVEPVKQSAQVVRKLASRRLSGKLDPLLETQFQAGRLYAFLSSRPGQSGRADGYILEGEELSFYVRKLRVRLARAVCSIFADHCARSRLARQSMLHKFQNSCTFDLSSNSSSIAFLVLEYAHDSDDDVSPASSWQASAMSLSQAALRKITKELLTLQNSPLEGIRIVPDDRDILAFQAWLEGPAGTPYAGGYFKVQFEFTPEFPTSPPKCRFATKIFHPNVAPLTGEICVNTLKKDWRRDYGIGHVLSVVKCLLIYPNAESALHEEAGRLLLEAYEDYASQARLMTSVHASRIRPAEFDIPDAETKRTAQATSVLGKSASPVCETKLSGSDKPRKATPTSAPLSPSVSFQNGQSAATLPLQASATLNSPVMLTQPDAALASKKRSVSSAMGAGTTAPPQTAKPAPSSAAPKKRGLKRL
ncbi:hypothetical protein E5Q_03945 [Mixia osmundae IAM 14324]|uniref:40S ribosomal protein S8 n=1 Tax=Mixia osmundae (strain CBS 9802 / IAM 14324 / JCM 22182 / KY 12970) TaxID=764103 RepID=G7E387_MIXOS|nr:hypothetical protein E5Q_03945 [Mixia osmundae IAM 14324]